MLTETELSHCPVCQWLNETHWRSLHSTIADKDSGIKRKLKLHYIPLSLCHSFSLSHAEFNSVVDRDTSTLMPEVAIPPAAVPIKLIYPAANPSLLWRWKAFLFSDLAALTAKSENKKGFSTPRRLGLPGCVVDMKLTCTIALQSTYHCRVNKMLWIAHYPADCRVNSCLFTRQPGK